MNSFLTDVLTFFQAYGYPAFGVSLFVAALGVPLPAGPMLLAAGAFAAQGDFNVATLLGVATGASVTGDCVGYIVGRLWGSRVLAWLPRSRIGRRIVTQEAAEESRRYFRQHGGSAVFLTRWLLIWFAGVVNIAAGAELYPFGYFLLWDVAGETLGALIPLALGFVFSASWEAASYLMATVSLLALGLLSALGLGYYVLRQLKRGRRAAEHAAVHADEPSAEVRADR